MECGCVDKFKKEENEEGLDWIVEERDRVAVIWINPKRRRRRGTVVDVWMDPKRRKWRGTGFGYEEEEK